MKFKMGSKNKLMLEKLVCAITHENIKSNCAGFALYLLGFNEIEEYCAPALFDLYYLEKHFEKAKNLDQADIVVIFDQFGLIHAAVIDPFDRDFVIHRKNFNAAIFREELISILFDKKYSCLKRVRSRYYKIKK